MKSIVTGATGFLGKHLCIRLKKLGHDVVGIGRNEKEGADLLKLGIDFQKGSLEDKNFVLKASKGADYIFHCGALSSVWGNPNAFFQANVIGTMNVVEAAKKEKVKRLIHVSTPSIYFNLEHTVRLNVKETDFIPNEPVNNYAATKLQAEKIIDDAFSDGLPVISIRPRALFGPGDNAIIPRLIKANKKTGVPIVNGGTSMLDVTYVGNVVDALILCMNSPKKTLGKKYNITNGEPMPLIDLLELVFKSIDVPFKKKPMRYNTISKVASFLEKAHKTFIPSIEPVLTQYTVSVLSHSQTLDISAAKKDLGYKPRVSVEEGAKLFAEWWKEQGGK